MIREQVGRWVGTGEDEKIMVFAGDLTNFCGKKVNEAV